MERRDGQNNKKRGYTETNRKGNESHEDVVKGEVFMSWTMVEDHLGEVERFERRGELRRGK